MKDSCRVYKYVYIYYAEPNFFLQNKLKNNIQSGCVCLLISLRTCNSVNKPNAKCLFNYMKIVLYKTPFILYITFWGKFELYTI